MKRKFSFCFFAIILGFLFSCNKKSGENSFLGFEVSGAMDSTYDGKVIYLKNGHHLDSASIIKGKFTFKGKINEPVYAKLYLDSTNNFKWFWLENNDISITSGEGKLGMARIKGSNLQQEEENLQKKIKPITNKRDKLIPILIDPNQNEQTKDSVFNLFQELQAESILEYENYIKQNPTSYLSVNWLKSNMIEIGKEKTKLLFNTLSKSLKETKKGKSINNFINLSRNPQVGEQFVNFNQMDKDGNLIDFSKVRGKVTLIEFWASWCKPCRASNPELKEIYSDYANSGFNIIGVSLDSDREKWLSAMEEDDLPWVNLSDLQGSGNSVALTYGVKAIPDNFLINNEGIIIARHLNPESLRQKLEDIISD